MNWCTALNTSLSNLEVDNKELEGRTILDVPGYEQKNDFGIVTYSHYEIEGSGEKVEVATTRPEVLGDTGIAVNPRDERYTHLVDKYATHPFIKRRLPIITGFGASIRLLEASDANPAGCVSQAVNADAACYLLAKEHVDIDAEINKAKVRLAKANEGVFKQRKIMGG